MAIYDGLEWGEPPDHRPYIVINMVTTADGKVTLDHNRYREPIGSDVDRGLMARLREGCDAVLRGAQTVRAYPYYPKAAPASVPVRKAAGRPAHPRAVVITGSCDLPLDGPYFQNAPERPLVLTSPAADEKKVAAVRRKADVEFVEPVPEEAGGGIDWGRALRRLREVHGIRRLVAEGGPRVNYDLFAGDYVDELFWTIAPKIAGQRDDLTMVEGPELILPLRRLRLMTAYVHEDELFLRYRVVPGAETPPWKGTN